MTVEDKDTGYDRALGEILGLGHGIGVYVGIRQAKGSEVDPETGSTVAGYATANEFGATIKTASGKKITIPERSFLRSAMAANEDRYTDVLGKELVEVLKGAETAEQALSKLGTLAVRDVQMTIRRGVPPPNAESTKQRKRSSKTLIDTGRMRQSIDYEVKRGNG